MENFIFLWLKIVKWISLLFQRLEIKFKEQFGFHVKETTIANLSKYLNTPKDSSSLAMSRILFGIAMLFDIPDERGGAIMEKRWGVSTTCHFPLIPFLKAIPMPYMALVYAGLWIGALGIVLGYKYRWSASMFTLCYWYIFLIEKSYWNNHSYLFGVVALLFTFTDANCYWSLDAYWNSSLLKETVPYWNYFILKYQFFILYFMAGLKKGTAEWLTGYSVQNLSEHWVFNPFKLFLTVEQTDYLIVHWFVFAFDLTIAIWMMWAHTRHVAMLFCALFHLMNSRLFSIGMFPWVCLATMPLFYPFDWPKRIIKYTEQFFLRVKEGMCNYLCKFTLNVTHRQNETEPNSSKNNASETCSANKKQLNKIIDETEPNFDGKEGEKTKEAEDENTTKKNGRMMSIKLALIIFHVVSQAFLPYSHFITKGYNNWTKGLYGYSWDMMVHTWDLDSVIIKVVDNEQKETFYVDPNIYAPNDRWTRHGDMVHQYARCLKENIEKSGVLSGNISIYLDVWCSLNGRFTQRMFDPKVDLLIVTWSVFEPVSYLMPLLDQALEWRSVLHQLKDEVHSWNNYSDVMFIADFPGYTQEKYIPEDLFNITMTLLDGVVAYEPEVTSIMNGQSYQLKKGSQVKINSGSFHKIINIGTTPAYYMYTFANSTEATNTIIAAPKPKLPINQELMRRFKNMFTFAKLVITNLFEILFKLKHCS